MGKPLNQQRRGKGSPSFTRPSHRFVTNHQLPPFKNKTKGEVVRFVDDPARSGLLMEILFEDKSKRYLLAPEGIKLGDFVFCGQGSGVKIGNVLPLSEIPEGTQIYAVELNPMDGGKLVTGAGTCAYIIGHAEDKTSIRLPSKTIKTLNNNCRAVIGVVSGSGRGELPFLKAGKKHHAMKARNMSWPKVRGVKMSAFDHPFGGKEHHTGKSSTVGRSAPPGRKVGHIAARRTGRKTRSRGDA